VVSLYDVAKAVVDNQNSTEYSGLSATGLKPGQPRPA
jgi:pyruvate kinase